MEKDRSGQCYRCGQEGYLAPKCSAAPHCPLCADLERPAEHRLEARACHPTALKKGGTAADKERPQQKEGGGGIFNAPVSKEVKEQPAPPKKKKTEGRKPLPPSKPAEVAGDKGSSQEKAMVIEK